MDGISIGSLVARLIALLSAIVVLGLSGHLLSRLDDFNNSVFCPVDNCFGSYLTAIDYAVFVGVWGLVAGAIGLAQWFLTASILGVVTLVVDGLAVIFYLAGGINLAVAFGKRDNGCHSGVDVCDQTDADIAFLFIGFVAALTTAILVFVTNRRNE